MNAQETQMTDQPTATPVATATATAPAKRVNLTKAELLARGKITIREVHYPKADVTLLIRNPRYERKTEILAAFNNKPVPKEGEEFTPEFIAAGDSARSMELQKALVLECVVNEDGSPFFDESDWQELILGDGLVVAEVSNELLVSMGGKKVKDEGNGSAQT